MKNKGLRGLALGLSVFAVTACTGASEDHEDAADDNDSAAMAAAPDTTGAAMWNYIHAVDYQANWQKWPGKGELYAGTQPHGMLLTTYLNDVAAEALANHAGTMPAGAIIVKENYMPDSTLAAVTTMYKVSGYNAEHNDWFFTKHLASGELDTMPNGMQMEGRLPGCQGCHGAKADNDYIYTGSLSEE